jgi:glycerol kinase
MNGYVAAIDQGTTSTRFMVFDHAGNEVGRHRSSTNRSCPGPGGWSTTRWRSGNEPGRW